MRSNSGEQRNSIWYEVRERLIAQQGRGPGWYHESDILLKSPWRGPQLDVADVFGCKIA